MIGRMLDWEAEEEAKRWRAETCSAQCEVSTVCDAVTTTTALAISLL